VEAVPKEHQAEIHKAVTTFRETAQKRHDDEARMLSEGTTPMKPTDPPKPIKIDLPRAPLLPAVPDRPKPLPVKEEPKPPPPPKHEDKPIPPHDPPKFPTPPKDKPPAKDKPKDKGSS
jgi:hypothetical protein